MSKTITQHIPLYLIAVIYLIAVVTFILITVSISSPTATPTGTVNAYLDAMAAQNPQKMVTYETEDLSYFDLGPGNVWTPTDRIEILEHSFEDIKSSSITNRNLVVDAETETTATVSVSSNFFATYTDGSIYGVTISTTYELTKVEGKWLISGEIED